MDTPDHNATGLFMEPMEADRYDLQPDDPHEVAGMLRALMPSNCRVLDVGCGTGSVTLIANRGKGNDVRAIEPDPTRAVVAQTRGIAAQCGFLDEDFLASGPRYDVIMSSDVIEHLADPSDMLRLMHDGLEPDGLLLISVPNVAHWSVRIRLLFGNFDYAPVGIRDGTHLRWFTQKTIRALVVSCGFEVIFVRQTAGADLPEYGRKPWRWIPPDPRRRLIQMLTRAAPLLFGCQHVLACRPRSM
jgi:SAM-dependent methyltransferase